MGFHIVDIVIVSLVLFLAIKGLVNGFSKELISLLSIIGGIALAARYNTTAVEFINAQNIAPTISENYAKIVGFVLILVAVWIIFSVISAIITKISSKELGIISRIFGYLLSAGRYLLIFSLIIFGVHQSEFFKDEATKLKSETKLFVPMSKIGATLLDIDLNTTTQQASLDNNSSSTKEEELVKKDESVVETKENNSTETTTEETTETNSTMTPTAPLVEHNSSY